MQPSQPRILTGALVGLMLIAALQAVSFLGAQLAGLPFIPFDVFDWLARTLPGGIVTKGIEGLVIILTALGLSVKDTAKLAEGVIAVLIVTGIGVGAGALFVAILNRQAHATKDDTPGLILGAALAVPFLLISFAVSAAGSAGPLLRGLWIVMLWLAYGVASSRAYLNLAQAGHRIASTAENAEEALSVQLLDRRRFLIRMGGATAAITVVGAGLGGALAGGGSGRGTGLRSSDLPNADDSFLPAPGTRPEYPPIADHYRIDINLAPPVVDEATWRLPIAGMVDRPLELTLDDLRNNYEPVHQFITLMCISNQVGGDLIGTTRWTGVRLQTLLDEAGAQPGATNLVVTSRDGFHETVSLDLIRRDERIMLAYAWDNQPLPVKHGFPLRIYIPDRYGMKQPKWITGMEVTDRDAPGYWVVRGWDEQALIRMTSIIDTVTAVNDGGERVVAVGGIAFAGARGISRVEVQVDDGEWQAARLRMPLSDLTWAVWRYDWPFEAGNHTFTVRAFDGTGERQIVSLAPPHPSGATGLHSVIKRL